MEEVEVFGSAPAVVEEPRSERSEAERSESAEATC
jgi:hypothetical protein